MTHPARVRAVIEALTNEGPAPTFHRMEMKKLATEWPTLAGALADLLRAEDKAVPPELRGFLR